MGAWAGAGFRLYDAILGSAVGESASFDLRREDTIGSGCEEPVGSGRLDDIVQGRVVLLRTDGIVLWRVVRMSDRAAIAVPLAAVPAMPAVAAAPAKTRAPRVVAPVPARALPAVIVPAVIAAKEEELRLLDRKDLRRKKSAAHGGLGRARQRQGHARRNGERESG